MDPQKNDLTEQEELKILGEILEAYIDTPIEKDAFLISDLGLDSFLIVYFISEVDDRFGVTIEMPEHVEYDGPGRAGSAESEKLTARKLRTASNSRTTAEENFGWCL